VGCKLFGKLNAELVFTAEKQLSTREALETILLSKEAGDLPGCYTAAQG